MGIPEIHKYGFSELLFHEEGKAVPVSYKDLPAQEWVLTTSEVRLTGVIHEEGPKKFIVRHSFAGEDVEFENVRPSKQEFDVTFNMRRGRNTFSFDIGDDGIFQLDVFFKGPVRNWIEPFIKIAIFFVLIQTFVIKAFYIPTGSMENTFYPGDYILVDRVSLLFRPPQADDIIVFQYPKNYTQDFIKRLIGMPGDVLSMRSKAFYKNGKLTKEPFVVNKDHRRFGHGMFSRRDNWGPIKIKDDHFFMMGDNRDFSKDSRFWGQLPAWRVKGRAWLRYMPWNRIGFIRHQETAKEKKAD